MSTWLGGIEPSTTEINIVDVWLVHELADYYWKPT